MTQIGDRFYLDLFSRKGNVAQFSPDGSKFAFVTQKGDLRSDTVEFCLLVFRTADAFSSPRPEVVATFASSSNREGITDLTWLADSNTIVFLGEHPGEHPQIYRVDTTTKKLTQLTSHPTPVLQYSITAQGDSFVYLADAPPHAAINNEMLRDGFFVTKQGLDDIYRAGEPVPFDPSREIFAKTPQMDVPQRIGGVLAALKLSKNDNGLSISPNGKYATVVAANIAPPALWNEYKPAFRISNTATSCSMTDALACPMQYLLLDLQKKTAEPLMNAPLARSVAGFEELTWTRENSLLLVNAFLPLDSVDAKEREQRRTSIYAAEITLPEKKIFTIAQRQTPFDAFSIQPGREVDQFVTHSYTPAHGPALEFHRDRGGWKVNETNSVTAEPEGRLSVTLDQDMNSPPKLVATDPRTKRKAVLLDLNPQFAQLTFGRAEVFRWRTREGRMGVGSLYFPPDYVAGKRYPLVIQTHGFSADRFWPDGPFATASAAQPLANRGFLVLQMAMGNPEDKASLDEFARIMASSTEGAYAAAFFDSAVDELDQRGLIDPTRVGLTGFSRTEYHVLYALTHSKHRFAAAVVADGVNYGYANCVFYLTHSDPSTCKTKNGGGFPYGDGLAGWARESPIFRLDRIEAPLLLQAILAPLGELEILEGLRWLKKPVEMLNFYPEGEHVLVRPQQRLLSQGSVVDWYCFWLKNEEDPDPAKAEQYKRWRELRKLQEAGRATQTARAPSH